MVRGLGRAALTCSSTCNRRTPFGPPKPASFDMVRGLCRAALTCSSSARAATYVAARPWQQEFKPPRALERVPRSTTVLERFPRSDLAGVTEARRQFLGPVLCQARTRRREPKDPPLYRRREPKEEGSFIAPAPSPRALGRDPRSPTGLGRGFAKRFGQSGRNLPLISCAAHYVKVGGYGGHLLWGGASLRHVE